MEPRFTEPMARNLLAADGSPVRFENFCVDLFREVDGGVEYVPTSRSWDQGRDGRLGGGRPPVNSPVICCSLRTDVIDKADEDFESVAEHATPDSAIVCSNQEVSEHVADQVERKARGHAKSLKSVRVNGLTQLARLAVRYPAHVEKWYAGELANLRTALSLSDSPESVQLSGMRVALTTQLGGDAQVLQREVSCNLALTALAGGEAAGIEELTDRVSRALHLPRRVQASYLIPAVESLIASGHIQQIDGGYQITDEGRAEVRSRTEGGSRNLLEGRLVVRRLLVTLTGLRLPDGEFAHLWGCIQEGLATLFLENGILITEAVASILGGGTKVADHPTLQEGLHRLGVRVAGLGVGGARAAEVGQAVMDMFREQDSDAFRWLANLCVVYVSLCSLGLEPAAQEQVTARLREIDLILDTDVVLSHLSSGEPNHEAVSRMVDGWRGLGGPMYTAQAVLEEAAYHAWISQREYEETWRSLATMTAAQARHLIENVFVRGFHAEAKGQCHPTMWNSYVRNFRGKGERDFGRILGLLKDSGIDLLSDQTIDRGLAEQIEAHTSELRAGRDGTGSSGTRREHVERCERDGRLVALLSSRRRARQSVGGTAVIVSSAGLLRRACEKVRGVLGDPEPVLPVGAVAYLMALTPGVNLSLDSLRGVLFDTGIVRQLSRLDRTALRAIHASEQYTLAWSRRHTLKEAMREQVVSLALHRGQKPAEVAKQLTDDSPEATQMLTEVVASAVDRLAASNSEKEVERLRQRVAALEKELQRRRLK